MNELMELILFVLVMIGTPGPANLVLVAAGSKFGYRKNLPFILGLILGKGLLGIAIGLGLANLLTENPTLNLIFKTVSALYLIYLALLTFRSLPVNAKGSASDFGFFNGLILHPLNPKAWMMLVLAYSGYASQFEGLGMQIASIGLVFVCVQFICHSLYCLAGSLVSEWLKHNPWFNRVLASLTVLVVIYIVLQ